MILPTTQCPVCKGYKTTSKQPNIKNHIIKLAGGELIKQMIFGVKYKTPHADWLKKILR